MKLSRDLWLQVEPLLNTALDLQASERAAWLAGVDATHPEAAPVLRRMLETHERAERARELETVPRLAPAPEWSSAYAAGTRIGPFALLRPLGHGGMGEVWLARQIDGRVEREVALKLPVLHQQGETWRERFRRERDILARLEHPNIARLYDAGVTEAGQPWLAMEFVEGHTLSDYVAARSPTIPQRLALFRQVLAAVAHAHRHLVVHRDLKPANILIDTSGQVKLLDFGIAKLIDVSPEQEDADARDLTRLGGRVMTLRYAAPEQVAAEAITTATDIYSLGVILHELVTGASPYRAVREGKPLTESALLGEVPARPSSVAPGDVAWRVAGDLDAIILKAMRRDPQHRYASIDLLDEDIRAHVDRRPVRARAGTWRYLAGRFAVRHKLPLALASAVLVTLAAGLVMVEQQRRVAVAQKARAERHFASVRKLANSFMFDVHGEIENLAGSLKARGILVATSLEYLEQLSKEAAMDSALAVEVATAYRKLADLKGDQYGANLGDVDAAADLLRKASALLEPLDAGNRNDLKLQRERRDLSLARARMLRTKVNQESVAEARVAAGIAEHVARLPGADRDDRLRLARAYSDLGYAVGGFASDPPAGLAILAKALALLEPLARDDPADRAVRELLAKTYETASFVTEAGATSREEREKAMELLGRNNALLEALARDFPDHLPYARNVIRGYANLAGSLREIERLPEARAAVTKAVAYARPLAAANADNTDLQSVLMRTLAVACAVESDANNHEKAIALCREALGVAARLPQKVRETSFVRANVATVTGNLGISQAGRGMAENSTLPLSRRLSLLREGRTNLLRTRAFKQELVDRNIDAKGATEVLREIDENVAGIDAAIARLQRG